MSTESDLAPCPCCIDHFKQLLGCCGIGLLQSAWMCCAGAATKPGHRHGSASRVWHCCRCQVQGGGGGPACTQVHSDCQITCLQVRQCLCSPPKLVMHVVEQTTLVKLDWHCICSYNCDLVPSRTLKASSTSGNMSLPGSKAHNPMHLAR